MRPLLEWASPLLSAAFAFLSWRYFRRTRKAIHDAPRTVQQAARDTTASDGGEPPQVWR